MGKKSWGRLYGGTRNHRKIRLLAQKHPSLWTYWYVLIDLAIEVDDDGWIYVAPDRPYTFEELAQELHIKRADYAQRLCKTLEELGLITISDQGILLDSFAERNFISDSSTPRVQKYRKNRKEALKKETGMKRFNNVSETPQNRAEHSRTEQNGASPKKSNGDARPAFSCPHFELPQEYMDSLMKEYPRLDRDLIIREFSRMNDWLTDNPNKHKRRANGHLKNPRAFIRNWIERMEIRPSPGNETSIKKRHDPDCPQCRGSGTCPAGKMPDGSPAYKPCDCEINDGPSAN